MQLRRIARPYGRTRVTVAVGVIAGGAGIELVAGVGGWRSVLDWGVAAVLVVSAVAVPAVSARLADLLLAAGVLWYAGTLAALASPAWAGIAQVVVLAYRAPVLHAVALATVPTSRRRGAVVAAGYAAVLLPPQVAVPLTATLALALAVEAAALSRGLDSGRGFAGHAIPRATVPGVLGAVWASALTGASGDLLLVSNAFALSWVAAHVLSSAAAQAPHAVESLALQLGPSVRRAGPVTSVLATLLGDGHLLVRFEAPQVGWLDEAGRSAADPLSGAASAGAAGAPRGVTVVAAPGGGQVALVHGNRQMANTPLARAAATAAGLVLQSAAMAAQERRHTADIARSRRRLLEVADAERRDLAERLERGALGRLATVRNHLATSGTAADMLPAVDDVIDELRRLALGLFPSAVIDAPLEEMLLQLGAGVPLAVDVAVAVEVPALDNAARAVVYFVSAECLVNAVRYAQASTVTIDVIAGDAMLQVRVADDGTGGAHVTAGRGLAGLADRLAALGGTLTIRSPAGGPTVITAALPL